MKYLIVITFLFAIQFTEKGIAEDIFPILTVPEVSEGAPAAGKKVAGVAPEYKGTEVHHLIYLPKDWSRKDQNAGKRWPVIVEYTGNYFPKSGSTGEVEGAGLGYGLTSGEYIWVVLPFVEEGRQKNAIRWWGDEKATIAYAKKNVPRLCEEFGGDSEEVFLCGFSRGAIAVGYIGLHDDEIAKLWRGLISHDHFDGVKVWGGTNWGSPLGKYREEAQMRLDRLKGRPLLICNGGSIDNTRNYLRGRVSFENVTFLPVNVNRIFGEFPNAIAKHSHTDRWPLLQSPERELVQKWFTQVSEGN